MHIDAKKKRRVNLPQEVGFSLVARRFVKKKGFESTTKSGGEANATTNNIGFYPRMSTAKNVPIFILRPTSVRMWHKTVLRWVLSQGRSPTRQAVPKMPRTPSALPLSGRLRRLAINPTPPRYS